MNSDVQPGQELGPYRILNQVGQGGMATVYRAYHSTMDRYVALKVLPRKLAESPEFVGRFQQEARTIARLEHAHILPVHDYGEADGFTYLVMRYLEAGTLKERLHGGGLSLREVDRLFSQLADALDYAHSLGIVHRDLKPSNVMLDARSNLFLTDFGIAKLLQGDANFTSTGAMIGTPAYMSPEQAQGLAVDQRSDLYSLGIILYEMVTGRVPFEADTPLAVILKHVNAPLPPPSSIRPGLPPSLEKVLLRVLAKDPADRFPNVAALVAAWRAALQDASLPQATATGQGAPPAPPPPTLGVTAAEWGSAAAGQTASLPPPAAPTRSRMAVLGPLGAVGALALVLCGGGLCALLVYNQFFGPAAAGTPNPGGAVTEAATAPGAAEASPEPGSPLGTLVAPPESTLAPRPTDPARPALDGNWSNWTAANTIYFTVFLDDRLITGGPGGLTAWDPAGGEVLERFTTAEGLPGVYVTTLLVDDANDAFYIGTDYGLIELVGDQNFYYNSDNGLDSDTISAVAVTSGGLLVGTRWSSQDGGGLQLRVGPDEWERVGDFPSVDDTEANPDQLSNVVNALLADEEAGLLWVATENGLGRYDGSDWTRYGVDEGLPDARVTTLNLVDGALLAGTEGGLAFFNGESFELIPEAPQGGIYGVVAASDGSVWAVGGGGVARRNPDGDFDTWDYVDLPSYNIYGGVEGPDGTLYFGTEDGVVYFQGDDYAQWVAPNVPRSPAFGRVLHEPADDQVWFVREYGSLVDIFDPSADEWLPGPDLDCDGCVPMGWDEDGRLWAGGDLGLWIFGEDETEVYNADNGLPSEVVRAVAFGPEGTAWVGTEAGLVFYDNGSLTDIYDSSNSGLHDDEVNSLLLAADESLWVATDTNLARRLPDGEWLSYGQDDPFSQDVTVSDLAEDPDGNVWLSTVGAGLYRYRTAADAWDRYSPLVAGVDLQTTEFNTIAVGPDGSVWAGASFAGFARFDGERWFSYGDLGQPLHSNITDLFIDTDGTVWFATSGGASRYEP